MGPFLLQQVSTLLSIVLYLFKSEFSIMHTMLSTLLKIASKRISTNRQLQFKVKWLKFSPFFLSLSVQIESVFAEVCTFELSKQFWTQYDVTVHYVRTHNSHLFDILQFSQLISFGCVGFCYFQFGSCQFYWNHVPPSLPHHHSLPVTCLPIQQIPVWLGL